MGSPVAGLLGSNFRERRSVLGRCRQIEYSLCEMMIYGNDPLNQQICDHPLNKNNYEMLQRSLADPCR